MKRRTLACLAAIALATPAVARIDTGFLDRTATVAGKSYRYQVYVPADFESQKSWPVILSLHGAAERGTDGLLQTDTELAQFIRRNVSRFPFIAVFPQCGPGMTWSTPEMKALALAALDQSVKEFRGDRQRLYLTGFSMGGYGTWELAVAEPGRFAALVPISAGVLPNKGWRDLRVNLPDTAKNADPYAEVTRRIGRTSVWIFHGSADPLVPADESRQMAAALKAAGADFKYTEYPGVAHDDAWVKAYNEPDLVLWLLSKSLVR